MASQGDGRPPVWVGHISLRATDLACSTRYFERLGMRRLVSGAEVSVLELRGGTHLVLLPTDEPVPEGAEAPFDLMVDDLEATQRRLAEQGFAPSDVVTGKIHSTFTLTDPSGYAIRVNSSHVSDQPV